MGNILDYVAWRGDLPLSAVPLCDVDLAVLSQAAYFPMQAFVPEGGITLEELCREMLGEKKASFTLRQDPELAGALAKSRRFSGLTVLAAEDIFNARIEEQFAAYAVWLSPEHMAVVFRGTDDTLVGFKEDFNMGFESAVPAQLDAVAFTEKIARRYDGRLTLCGHSKGGNLAMYAAAFCHEDVRARVDRVVNFDGPGFSQEVAGSPACRAAAEKTQTYLPQSSIVGMLLEHAEDFTVVASERFSLLQHILYRWQVLGDRFVTVADRTNSSYFVDDTLKKWVAAMDADTRETMINSVYQAVSAAQGKTFRDLMDVRSILHILRAAGDLDKDQRHTLMDAGRMLTASMKASFPAMMRRLLDRNGEDQRE